MKIVLRFSVTSFDVTTFSIPTGSKFLSAVPGKTGLHLYFLCPVTDEVEPRHFLFVKTGTEFPGEELTHLYSLAGIHLFEVPATIAESIILTQCG